MATNTAGDTGRLYHTDQVHYLAKTIVFGNDDQVVTVGALPPAALVVECGCIVTTAFSANSVMDLGTAADPDAFASALVLTTAGRITDVSTNPLLANDDYTTSSTTVVASLTSSGAITEGSGVAYFFYILADR